MADSWTMEVEMLEWISLKFVIKPAVKLTCLCIFVIIKLDFAGVTVI